MFRRPFWKCGTNISHNLTQHNRAEVEFVSRWDCQKKHKRLRKRAGTTMHWSMHCYAILLMLIGIYTTYLVCPDWVLTGELNSMMQNWRYFETYQSKTEMDEHMISGLECWYHISERTYIERYRLLAHLEIFWYSVVQGVVERQRVRMSSEIVRLGYRFPLQCFLVCTSQQLK